MNRQTILNVSELCVDLTAADGSRSKVVSNVSFRLCKGETLGLVGESGSGKTVSCLALLRLLPDSMTISGGRVELEGTELTQLPESAMRLRRGKQIGMVFQDPMASFNPVRTIGSQLVETQRRHQKMDRAMAIEAATEALRKVGVPSPFERLRSFPHELSGGQLQRCMIAMAMINGPSLLIADEPTTALDATVQLQIIELLRRRAVEGVTILVTHDLGLAAELCDQIAVMYCGRIIEAGPTEAIVDSPRHPYTAALLALTPRLDRVEALPPIPGQPPTLGEDMVGCSFRSRCPRATPECLEAPPSSLASGDGNHRYECWNPMTVERSF